MTKKKKRLNIYLTFKIFFFHPISLVSTFFILVSLSTNSYAQQDQVSLKEAFIEGKSENEEILNTLQKAIELTNYGNYKEATALYELLDTSQLILANDSLRMTMLESRSFMNKVLKRFSHSLEDLLEMINYYTLQNDFNNLAKTETLLAEFYRSRDLKELAFKHLKIAEAIIEKEKVEPCNIAYWFSRRAACETQFQPNSDNIIFFCNKGLALADSECSKYTEALIYNELGFVYGSVDFDNEQKIIAYYQKSLNILLETNRLRDVATVKHNLATYYTRRGQLDAALNELNPTIELAEKNNWHGSLEDLYLLKMVILHSRGQDQEAYDISRKSYLSKVELMQDQYAIGVEELQAVHDKELAEKALAEAEIRAEANENALTYTIIGILLFGLSTVTALLLFLRVRKNNKLLTEQQKSIELTNEMLSNSLGEKETLYKELNHRVKNNLMVLSSLIYLQQHSENSEDSINDLYTALRNRIQTMAIVHEKLYGINDTKNINFQNYLEELIPLIYSSFKKGDIIMPYTVRCMSLFLPINKAIPLALIFNELITNSIKHATNDSLAKGIEIESHTDENGTVVQFKDFGPEFPIEINFSNPSSMGMKIVNLMTQQLKATLEHQSTESGLRFTIRFN
ncbi:MAG: hypothetical protein COW03_11065 [Cytophagales bacterium CG12_big_fil_rev_8_21_14_0_65_40_12]|nr:MAG: hypothetical protein COW03_11065 [Cytophagales bacterium CG12_big_fil_rev_8_21_14_0_65_40_12]PIW06331.1 MAG: hypothetical protein COW40_00015 [Cytophagales bacterium CG17_big_fil_post_rev_8_21_14_2_50_40_13]